MERMLVRPERSNMRVPSRAERWIRRQSHRPGIGALRRSIGEGGRAILTVVVALRKRLRRPGGARYIAFVGHNVLMVQTVLRAWSTIAGDPRLKAWLFVPWAFRHAGKQLAREAGLRSVAGLGWSRVWAWDLVVVANHVEPYHPGIPLVRMLHGVGSSSKLLRGHEFTYDPRRVLRADGTAAYARILESSQRVADTVVQRLPALADTVSVTGSIAADRMLSMRGAAPDIRREMGYEPSERVIVCMSTFGPHSLMETMGCRLIGQMRVVTVEGRYRFIVCSHPNLWAAHRRAARPWDAFLESQRLHGLRILEPGDDWARAFAVADAALSDHTSLAIAFALLGKPLAFVPVGGSAIEADSPIARLIQVSPAFSDPCDLGPFLDALLEEGASPQAAEIAGEIVTHRGEAASRTRAELYRLLELDTQVMP
jgi:hypothetical protein